MIIYGPKRLVFDIETSGCISHVWGTGKTRIQHESILKANKILCIGYMWHGEKEIKTLSIKINENIPTKFEDYADKEILRKFRDIYNSADSVITYNGDNFDIATIRGRLLINGLPDLHPIPSEDVYKIAKKMRLISGKLDSVCNQLDIGRKIRASYALWTRIIFGNDGKSLKAMVKYMAQDVRILNRAYNILKNYAKPKLNRTIIGSPKGDSPRCPGCNSLNLMKYGFHYSMSGKKQKLLCKNCGRLSRRTSDKHNRLMGE